MPVRNASLAIVSLAAGVLAACDSPTDPSAKAIPGSAQFEHGTSTTACVDGAVTMEVSVYPKSIAPNANATPYASVYDGGGTSLPAYAVRWVVADTNVATITGTDENGRPIITGRAGGTTQVVANCGSVGGSAALTVSGPPAPGTSNTTAAKVTVSSTKTTLTPGESIQAGVSALDAAGTQVSAASATWNSSNASIATVSSTGLVTAVANGSATITASVGSVSGTVSITVNGTTTTSPTPVPPASSGTGVTATPAALPQSVPNVQAIPAVSRQIRVPAGGDLQSALDQAQLGDAILLAPGASFTGNYILRDKGGWNSCGAWITIRTDGALPPQGQRVTPSSAASFAKIYSPSVAPAIKTDVRASCYRIMGVEVALPTWLTSYNYGLIALGDGGWSGGGELQKSVDLAPTNLVLDRVYVHGQSGSNFTRCIALNSASTAIVDSWISDCHAKGFDSQAIAGWNGPGPYLIENNFLGAAGENVMFGGADPGITNLVPSDITIRRNHFYKNPSWKGVWTVKNLFELKSSRRTLVEGNVFENNWADAQTGMAIVIKSANDGGTGPWQGTTDLTFRYNIVRNSPQGLNIAAIPESNPAVHVTRVNVENNFFENIGVFNGSVSGRMLILLNDLKDITIANNTMIHNTTESGLMAILDNSGGAARNIVMRDNVATKGGPYGALLYSGIRIGSASLDAFATGSWSFDRNVVIGIDAEFVPWHPQSSWYPFTMGAVGFNNAAGGDYSLSASSPYRGKGLNGSDPGADFGTLRRLTGGVVMQ
jgi:Bacterial Ig-like domain (group 2)